MKDLDRETGEVDLESQSFLNATNKFCFKEKGSILKVSTHTWKKDSEASQGYFKPRSNIKQKNKRGIFRKMTFKTYLKLSLPIAIQYVTEYGATETKILETITEFWKVLLSVNRRNVILSWIMALKDGTHTETTNVDGLYKNSDKKAVADKYIELLQMGCFASNTTVRFRLGHNFSIDALLEDPNPSYSLKKFDTDITHDKIQSTDTVIAVWLGGGGGAIPEQATSEVLE